MNLVALVDSASTEFGDFKVLIRQKVDNDATQEEVDAAVCEALVESLSEMAAAAKKGRLVVTIDNTTMTDQKVFIYAGTDKQVKIKFEISDNAATKVPYQLAATIESSGSKMNYPQTGYDTLLYNQEKEIVLDSIPQGKYSVVCKAGKKEYKLSFIIRKQKLEITKEQLKKIFPNTNDARIKEVVEAINEYSSAFDIGTPERMAHFIGQIGAETGGLVKLKESFLYSPRAIAKTFGSTQYSHLFENAVLDSSTYKYNYNPINFDENKCDGDEIPRGNTVLLYKTSSEIKNAYAAIKSDTLEVILNKKTTKIPVYKNRTDVTKDNIEKMVKDSDYNNGLLRVKSKYIRSLTLFDVTYACRMGNDNVASKDGSTFLGKGFIHITGKGGYKEVSIEWNMLYPNDKKEFHGSDISLLETDVKIAIKASMIYWKIKNLNEYADTGINEPSIDDVGRIVNGSGKGLPNGYSDRRKYSRLAYSNIKN